MRKILRMRYTMDELIDENKKELLNNPQAMKRIEERLDEKKANEVHVRTFKKDDTKKIG
ncbi:FbpB family small basic protein [Aliibacillus thermotolerans]|uniref:FbpB family small basic protein n=1 Tax=Aliibacillus thermotolerans TaxID=1834418 RepID=A0ABW0U5G8_9BACI|nr:FbpB family small basic protein [Aliibacillus thermotolerans]MDA3128792.1 FbpB family small basic protein [Aliibacillus thermotolerans]